MKYIYLFNKQSLASASGVGTYINQIKEIILGMNDVKLNIVNYNLGVNEFSVIHEGVVSVYNFPVNGDITLFSKERKQMRNLWYILFSYIKINETDKLIFHFNYYPDTHLVPFVKEKFPFAKTLFTIHYSDWGLLLEGNTSYFRRIIQSTPPSERKDEQNIYNLYKRDKEVFAKVDHIISLCRYTQSILEEEYRINADKISLIPNGLKDERIILTDQERKRIRKEWNIAEDEKVILFVGRLEKLKGLDELISAFKVLHQTEPNIRLLVVGDGIASTYILQAKKHTSKISFLGRLSKEELFGLYQIADVGVLPSKNEQCSYVAIEMMMFDIPLVLSSTSGLKEMCDHAEIVEIVEKEESVYLSPEKLSKAIKKQLENPIRETRRDYEEKYTLEIMSHNMYNLYNSLFTK